MCFPKPPQQPAPVDTGIDQELTIQRQAAEENNAVVKAANKQRRMDDSLLQLSGKIGRRSLFTGGQGGQGFPGGRTLVPVMAPIRNPTPVGQPMPVSSTGSIPIVGNPQTGIRIRYGIGGGRGASLIDGSQVQVL